MPQMQSTAKSSREIIILKSKVFSAGRSVNCRERSRVTKDMLSICPAMREKPKRDEAKL